MNAVGTVNLAEAVRHAAPGARLLVVSTGEVYGDTGDGPASEDQPVAPRSPYAASKAAAEIAAGQAARAYGLDVVLARPFAHNGPGHDRRFALPSFALQIAELERAGGGELKVGDLSVHRDLLDVRDVVAAYIALPRPAWRPAPTTWPAGRRYRCPTSSTCWWLRRRFRSASCAIRPGSGRSTRTVSAATPRACTRPRAGRPATATRRPSPTCSRRRADP